MISWHTKSLIRQLILDSLIGIAIQWAKKKPKNSLIFSTSMNPQTRGAYQTPNDPPGATYNVWR
jgi:hypothetical protein